MQVQCPGCSKTLRAPDSAAGKVVKCPACGGQMQLPEAAAAASPELAPGAAPKPPRPGSARRSGPPAPAGAGDGATKSCPYCREQIQANAIKCRHCGELLDARQRRLKQEAAQLAAGYQAGMRGLGIALFIIGGLIGGVGLLIVFAFMGVTRGEGGGAFMAIMLGAIGAVVVLFYLLPGFFAMKLHNWVNWLIVVLYAPGVIAMVVTTVLTGRLPAIIPAIINVALLLTAINNLRKHARVRAAGADPRGAAGVRRLAGSRRAGAARKPTGRRK